MIKKKFKIPIYFGTLTVIQDDDELKGVEKMYNTGDLSNYDALVLDDPEGKSLEIAVAFKKNTTVEIIAHEAVHIVNIIYKTIKR